MVVATGVKIGVGHEFAVEPPILAARGWSNDLAGDRPRCCLESRAVDRQRNGKPSLLCVPRCREDRVDEDVGVEVDRLLLATLAASGSRARHDPIILALEEGQVGHCELLYREMHGGPPNHLSPRAC